MTLEDFYMISQVVAALAVMASLIFVGMQVRHSDRTQRAVMHQERTHRNIDVTAKFLEPHNQAVLAKSRTIEQVRNLSMEDRVHLFWLLRINLLSTEETLWQHRQGLLDEEVLEDQRQQLVRLFSLPVFKALWQRSRTSYREDFRSFVDGIDAATGLRSDAAQSAAEWGDLLDAMVADQLRAATDD